MSITRGVDQEKCFSDEADPLSENSVCIADENRCWLQVGVERIEQKPLPVAWLPGKFIVFQGMIKEKGLQALVQILYQILDKTRNVVL